jgi:hypothetical protein
MSNNSVLDKVDVSVYLGKLSVAVITYLSLIANIVNALGLG